MTTGPAIVMARFIEAAHTESFLPSAKMPTAKGYWPAFQYDEADIKGWDEQAKLDNATKWRGRASSGAISRHHECMEWTATIIKKEISRKIVWTWAFCKARKWDFSAKCDQFGWSRGTAYRRLTAAFEAIAEHFDIKGVLVRLPDDKWLRHENVSGLCDQSQSRNRVSASAIPFASAFRLERSIDLLQTPEDLEAFEEFLTRTNAQRRAEQKKRKLLGIEEVAA